MIKFSWYYFSIGVVEAIEVGKAVEENDSKLMERKKAILVNIGERLIEIRQIKFDCKEEKLNIKDFCNL